MKKITRDIIEKLFSLFGYKLCYAKKNRSIDLEVIDKFLVSSYYNKNINRISYEKSLKHTNMEWSDNFSKQCRYYVLYQIVEYILNNNNEGDVAECGCWKGHSGHLIASILKSNGFSNKFHIFDSFEGGLSALQPEDKNERFELSEKQIEDQKIMFASTLAEVKENLKGFDFIEYYEGWIPERFPEVDDRKFSFVHLDVDLYQPFYDSLEFFYPRLLNGGVISFDDYGLTQFPGAKKSIDDYLSKVKYQIFIEIPTGGAFVIK